jgi:hypothetical protein
MNQPSEPASDRDEIHTRCTACGFVGTLDDFDVMGADPRRLFCPVCTLEVAVERAANEDASMN